MAANLTTLVPGSRLKGAIFTVLLGLVALSSNSRSLAAQTPDESTIQPKSTLYLHVSSPGQLDLDLYVLAPPASGVSPFLTAIGQTCGCETAKVSSIDYGGDGLHLHAQCLGAIPLQGAMAQGNLNFSLLLRELSARGVDTLVLNILFHVTDLPFETRKLSDREARPRFESIQRYNLPTLAASPAVIRVQMGYASRDVASRVLPLLVLLLLPVILTLYARRSVLGQPDASRSGAWFGYWRFLHWNTFGSFLLWVTAVGALGIHPFLRFVLSANTPGTVADSVSIYAFYFVPPILISIVCRILSHRVFEELQGAEWTRTEVFEQALWAQLTVLAPLALVVTGMSLLGDSHLEGGALSLLLALFSVTLGSRRLQKLMSTELHALSTGELRDRAFALATQAKVKLQQVYLMPMRKLRMANAFARRGHAIILTDYLLENLSKREVDGVIAHELGHFKRHRHPIPIFVAVISGALGALVAANHEATPHWLPESALIPLGVLFLILMGNLTSRRAERFADAAAVELTGDAEGFIRALVKLSALNRMPIHWGRLGGKLLSHPSTFQRAEALARQAGIPAERLTQMLSSPDETTDHYPVPSTAAGEGKAFSTTFRADHNLRVGWLFNAVYTVTPAVFAFTAFHARLPVPRWCVLVLGLVATLLLTTCLANDGPVGDGRTLKTRTLQRLTKLGMAPDAWGGTFVGFSPHPLPRIYDGNFIWDVGFLILAGDGICYWGEETRFALRREQITKIRLGPGHPSWRPSHRLYITWKDEEKGTTETFNLVTAESRSLRGMFTETAALEKSLQAWQVGSTFSAAVPLPLASLDSPAIGEVTCLTPRLFGRAHGLFAGMGYLAAMALIVAVMFGLFDADGGWGVAYTISVAIFAAIAARLPYTFYRDRPG